MPGFNGTGPSGKGPMTGRGMGKCRPQGNADKSKEASAGSNKKSSTGLFGRGRGLFGLGRRRGRRSG